jgi:hypothetical protein
VLRHVCHVDLIWVRRRIGELVLVLMEGILSSKPTVSMDLEPGEEEMYSSVCEVNTSSATLYRVRLLAREFV